MQIVIEIPDELYRMQLDSSWTGNYIIRDAIVNGTLLPKGHGRLKDMGNLQYVFDLTREEPIYSGKDIERAIKSMKTIIEADKTKSEE